MKASLSNRRGMSLVELVLAMAIGSILLPTIFISMRHIEDGLIWSSWRMVANQKITERIKSVEWNGFFATTSGDQYVSHGDVVNASSCLTNSCVRLSSEVVSDVPCGKKHIETAWFLVRHGGQERSLRTSLYQIHERDLVDRGGDCAWLYQDRFINPTTEIVSLGGNFDTLAIDSFDDLLVMVGSSSPQVRVYRQTSTNPQSYSLVASTTGDGRRINAVDVVRDQQSDRLFAYVLFHDRVNQLGVFELFYDQAPLLRSVQNLGGVSAVGSFPQGWRIMVYGDRLFAVTRETAGAELHIFSVSNPLVPTEIIPARTELFRTVNDMEMFSKLENGQRKEYLVLGASAALKELALFDVTGLLPVEVVAINLPGTSNVDALYMTATHIYLGRQAVTGGPELYKFSIESLLLGSTTPEATYEVGAGVGTITVIGNELLVTTTRSPSDIDRYTQDAVLWQTNNARLSRVSSPGLLPYQSDRIDTGALFVQRANGNEAVLIIDTP
jgi:prepilin-type N-terminal cleavage/methylation domain-containing protein